VGVEADALDISGVEVQDFGVVVVDLDDGVEHGVDRSC
jgi:hypothetical protein